jgi:hypothetical protein
MQAFIGFSAVKSKNEAYRSYAVKLRSTLQKLQSGEGRAAEKLKKGTASGPHPFKLYVTDELCLVNYKSEKPTKKYKGQQKTLALRCPKWLQAHPFNSLKGDAKSRIRRQCHR